MQDERSLRTTLGLILCRVVVPLWILVGAVFKLVEATPTTLPSNIIKASANVGMDLYITMSILIGFEFLAVGVMVFLGKQARAMAIFMLACFCVILIGEMMAGKASCGCFGSASPPPWVMLAIDGGLLLGVLATGAIAAADTVTKSWAMPGAAMTTAAGFAAAFLILMPERNGPQPGPGPIDVTPAGWVAKTPTSSYWLYDQDAFDGMQGSSWRDIELMTFLAEEPVGLDTGRRHVIFYRRNCDHCLEMIETDLSGPRSTPVTLVEVPVAKDALRDRTSWAMPETTADQAVPLPLGYDWILQTPVILTFENGRLACSAEGDHERCLNMAAGPILDPVPTGPNETASASGWKQEFPTSSYWLYDEAAMTQLIGKPWTDVELLRFLPLEPVGVETGRRHFVFYGRTCEHCEEMVNDLHGAIADMVTLIEVPVSKALRGPNPWELPKLDCYQAGPLPLGYDWIFSTPVVISVQDGIVICVSEGDHEPCFNTP